MLDSTLWTPTGLKEDARLMLNESSFLVTSAGTLSNSFSMVRTGSLLQVTNTVLSMLDEWCGNKRVNISRADDTFSSFVFVVVGEVLSFLFSTAVICGDRGGDFGEVGESLSFIIGEARAMNFGEEGRL